MLLSFQNTRIAPWFLFALLLIFMNLRISAGSNKTFECYCRKTRSVDGCDNGICYTNGACYYGKQVHYNVTVWKAGCYNHSKNDPLHSPALSCALLDKTGYCCKTNKCNVNATFHSTTVFVVPTATGGTVSASAATLGDETWATSISVVATAASSSPKPAQVDGSIIAITVVVGCAAVVLLILYVLWKRKRDNSGDRDGESVEAGNANKRLFVTVRDFCLPRPKDISNPRRDSATSVGSSALFTGNNATKILEQETVAKKTELSPVPVSKGRFGEVYVGILHGDRVAVKIFPSKEAASWQREVNIYQTVMLQHENILRFIAADNKDAGAWTEFWLVTEYHENGSLFNYLSSNTLDQEALFKIVYSSCCGLAHLHTEVVGIRGKPAIAHRDIKSNNILVKKDGNCAIGDLGLAVCYNSQSNTIDIPTNERVGTRRYMPPEVIENTLNMRSFDAFKNADMYSFSLVLWEIVSRNNITGIPDDYLLPYSETLPHDPSVEDLRTVVVDNKRRPRLKKEWENHPVLLPICKIIRECWSDRNEARLPIQRVKKTLNSLVLNGELKM